MESDIDIYKQLYKEYAEYADFLSQVISEQHDFLDQLIDYLEKGDFPLIENVNGVNKMLYLIS